MFLFEVYILVQIAIYLLNELLLVRDVERVILVAAINNLVSVNIALAWMFTSFPSTSFLCYI